MEQPTGQYDAAYYEDFIEGGRASADVIAPILVDHGAPSSVLDVGAGAGYWLDAFAALGVEDRQAVDGPFNSGELLRSKGHPYRVCDLQAERLRFDRRFDLAICFEVAEHLGERFGPLLVADLVALAETVAFSAAIPGQIGEGHVNLRPQSYWVDRFAEQGYFPLDLVRPRVWADERVKWWYAQNTLVFTPQPGPAIELVNVVHPTLLAQTRKEAERGSGGRAALASLTHAVRRRLPL